jgi:hypothetical protein
MYIYIYIEREREREEVGVEGELGPTYVGCVCGVVCSVGFINPIAGVRRNQLYLLGPTE